MAVGNKSKAKGTRAEAAAAKYLSDKTGWKWERIPLSGALDEKHGLKGDIYIPKEINKYCIEVKHYKDDHLTSKALTDKSPILLQWWEQAVREAKQNDSDNPLLIFKFDRSKWFAGFREEPINDYRYLYHSEGVYLAKLDDYLKDRKPNDWVYQKI